MKYNKHTVKGIITSLAGGMLRTDAVILANISYETFADWMNKKPEFSDAVLKAETKSKSLMVNRIRSASKKSWTAAAWWLERKFPDEFREKKQVDYNLSGSIGIGVIKPVDLSTLTDVQLNKLADGLARRIESKKE